MMCRVLDNNLNERIENHTFKDQTRLNTLYVKMCVCVCLVWKGLGLTT